MKNIQQKEIWFARFPLEEDENKTLKRPVLVVHSRDDEYLVIKVTTHEPRDNDKLDVEIKQWQAANLKFPSTARVSKLRMLPGKNFINKIGVINDNDWETVTEKIEQSLE